LSEATPEKLTYTALCEERADDSREDGDDKLDDGFPGLDFLKHHLEVKSEK
jgi:hypothetical protein